MWAWGAIEADFRRFYKIDLVQEGLSNRLSWRRFLVLLRGLPVECAFTRWLADKEKRSLAEWSEDDIEFNMNAVKGGGR